MIKVSIAELNQALEIFKKTSQDVHILVREEGDQLTLQFQNVDGQLTSIKLYDESTRSFAKIQTIENLAHFASRGIK